MVLNSLFPVFILIVLGNGLKRYNLTNEVFLKTSDKLVYFIFFPAMLFWKIGSAPSAVNIEWGFCLSALLSILTIFIFSIVCIKIFRIRDYGAGSFSQSCYRFNTYIGMAVMINAFGQDAVQQFGVLIGFVIPLANVLAVSTLIWFSGKDFTRDERFRFTFRALVSNPLIIACIAGILYSGIVNRFPVFLDNAFRLAASVTLPLALISIGGALTIDSIKGHFKPALMASALKLGMLPLVGYFYMKGFHVNETGFRVGMIFFALPTSTAIYVLSSQLNSDIELASASIVLSTALSFISMTVVLLMLDSGWLGISS